jgi:cation diffusion facilitator family transporter
MDQSLAQLDQRHRLSVLVVDLGLAANAILATLKLGGGILGHSQALLADGVNSTSDVAYFLIVRILLSMVRKPADEEHPYGHRQFESIAALVVGAFVLTTAVAVFWDSVNKVYDLWAGNADAAGASWWALPIAGFTVVSKLVLARYTRKVGLRLHNPAVTAIASDHRNDVFAATAAAIGIFAGHMGLLWADPMAGAVVAVLILKTGIEIIRGSSKELMDTVPGRELRDQVMQRLSPIAGVLEVEEILAHRFGPYIVINVTIGVDGSRTVADGDRIATQAEHVICHEIDMVQRVHVHYHPARTDGGV